MQFDIIINQILTLFLIIFVGYIMRKKELITEEISKGLSTILINVTLPALIIANMEMKINPQLIDNIVQMAIISIVGYIIVIIFANFFTRGLKLPQQKKTIFKFAIIFNNIGYMGYPVINAIYPKQGIFYAIVPNLVFNLLIWTYGIYIFLNDQNTETGINLRKILNNGIIAIIIGSIVFVTQYKIPGPIAGALNSLGNMTFPLSMIIIGSSLSNIKFSTIFKDKYLYLLSLLRLIIIPFSALLILKQLNLPEVVSNISIMLLAMPAAANGVIFAEKFEGDYKFASESVFLSTLFSLLTIPVFIWLIQNL